MILGALLVTLVGFLVISELGLRLFFKSRLRFVQDERSMLYRYDSVLGWFPPTNTTNVFAASRPITVIHNSQGFRDIEPVTNSHPAILFVGDSFVWGYDVEASERFTDKLRAKHPEWNVFNLGVSGYGTDQELLLLQMNFQKYAPRLVVLIYSTDTDDDDNSSNARYGDYYKPYCRVAGDKLLMEGVPVPRSERAFLAEHRGLARSYLLRLVIRAWFKFTAPPVMQNPSPTDAIIRTMNKYVSEQGAYFVVGLTQTNSVIDKFFQHYKIPFIDLDTSLRYPSYGKHWTPAGHDVVCERIEKYILENGLLAQPASNSKTAVHE